MDDLAREHGAGLVDAVRALAAGAMGDSLKIAYLGAGVLEDSLRFRSAPPSEALVDEFDAAARQDAAVRAAVQCMWWDESDPHRARFQRFAGPASSAAHGPAASRRSRTRLLGIIPGGIGHSVRSGTVDRRIVGFERDDAGDWVAVLDCLHRQHVRHRPPLWPAPWVDDDVARQQQIGAPLACPLCDRTEIPADLEVVRTTVTWDEHSMPNALRRAHRVASGMWGRLRVDEGRLRFVAQTTPITDVLVEVGRTQGIPPDVEHFVETDGPVRFAVEFLARQQ